MRVVNAAPTTYSEIATKNHSLYPKLSHIHTMHCTGRYSHINDQVWELIDLA